MPSKPGPPTRGGAVTSPFVLVAALAVVAVLASYRLISSHWDAFRSIFALFSQNYRGYAVVHGGVAKPEELVAHGKR